MSGSTVPRKNDRLVHVFLWTVLSLGIGLTFLWAAFLAWLIVCAVTPLF